jgi:hypothetical protein
MSDLEAKYAVSRFDEGRVRGYARRVAEELVARNAPASFRSAEGTQLWPIASMRGDGTRWMNKYRPPPAVESDGYMEGEALLLSEDGRILYAAWEWFVDPSRLRFNELHEATAAEITAFDRFDRGRWKDERPNPDENMRERFSRWFTLGVHAKGVGASLGLKRLREGGTKGPSALFR